MALALQSGTAMAQSAQGHSALALGRIVGGYSPLLTASKKAVLAALMAGHAASVAAAANITINADQVRCRAGNVDITAYRCDLKFGAWTKHLSGRAANELFATLGEAGVPDDGAAGTIYHSVSNLSCTISPHDVAQNTGGGASCAYTVP
jgi:hypothetical protein